MILSKSSQKFHKGLMSLTAKSGNLSRRLSAASFRGLSRQNSNGTFVWWFKAKWLKRSVQAS